MPKLVSSRIVEKVLIQHGFALVSQKGGHLKYRSRGGAKRTVIVPARKKEIPLGTLNSIVRQSGLPRGTFFEKT